MNSLDYNITDWHNSYEDSSMELERSNVQGKSIRLEIIKQHFLGRALAFDEHYCCLAVSGNKVIGSAIAAKTVMKLNNTDVNTGFGFDAKVHPAWRNRGIGKSLALKLYENYFSKHGLHGTYMTAKQQNIAVHKMVKGAISGTHAYPFVYLTIPVDAPIKNISCEDNQNFSVGLFNKKSINEFSFTDFESGLGCFYTNKFYSIRVSKISLLARSTIAVMKLFQPSRFKDLPTKGSNLFFATLYNHNSEHIRHLHEVLYHLRMKGIQYLQVCCQENDCIYRQLKKYAFNVYPYCIRSDFEINASDKIALDVRCL